MWNPFKLRNKETVPDLEDDPAKINDHDSPTGFDFKAVRLVHSISATYTLTGLKNAGIEGVDSKLLKELSEDNIDESLIGEEIAKLSEEYDLRATTWRHRMVHFLHTVPVEVFMITLVILDVLILLAMVVLDMYVLQGEIQMLKLKGTEILVYVGEQCSVLAPLFNDTDYDLIKTYTALVRQTTNTTVDPYSAAEEHHRRKRAVAPVRHEYGNDETFASSYLIYTTLKVSHILHYSSIAILSVFVIELVLKIIGYGKNYFKNKWEVIDGVVILISFSMDIAITDQQFSHEVGKTVLVVFLMWRVIRILNAMVLTSRARTMFRVRVLRKAKKILEDKNKALSLEKQDLMEEVKKLREIATAYGAPNHEVQAIRALSKTNVSQTKAGLKNMMAQILNMNAKIASVSTTSLNRIQSRRPSMIGDDTLCHERDEVIRNRTNNLDVEPGPMRERAASDAGMTRFRHKNLFSALRGRKDSLATNQEEKKNSQSNENLSPGKKSLDTPTIIIQEHHTIHEHHEDHREEHDDGPPTFPHTTENNNDTLQPPTPSHDTGIQPSLTHDLNSESSAVPNIKITADCQPNGHVVVDYDFDNEVFISDGECSPTLADPNPQPISQDTVKLSDSAAALAATTTNGHVSIQIPEINVIDHDSDL